MLTGFPALQLGQTRFGRSFGFRRPFNRERAAHAVSIIQSTGVLRLIQSSSGYQREGLGESEHFTLDHGIHAYIVDAESADWADLAVSHIRENFDGVLSRLFDAAIADARDVLKVSAPFENAELDPYFEVFEDQFMLWRPSPEKHHTQSRPA